MDNNRSSSSSAAPERKPSRESKSSSSSSSSAAGVVQKKRSSSSSAENEATAKPKRIKVKNLEPENEAHSVPVKPSRIRVKSIRATSTSSSSSSAAAAAAAAAPKNSKVATKKRVSTQKMEPKPEKISKPRTKKQVQPLTELLNCGICFEEKYAFTGTLDCCKHAYCFECIIKWAESSNTCPQCKRRFTKVEKFNVATGRKTYTKKIANKDLGRNEAEIPFPFLGMGGYVVASPTNLFNILNHIHNPVQFEEAGLHLFHSFLTQSILAGFGSNDDSDDDSDDDSYDYSDYPRTCPCCLQISYEPCCPFCGMEVILESDGSESDEDDDDDEGTYEHPIEID